MKRVHYISGITITLFIVLHLFNHAYGLLGPAHHISMMDSLRLIYRNPVSELILLIAVFTQIYSGIKLVIPRRKAKLPFFGRLQVWSGLYLAFFLLMHVSAVFGARFILQLDTNIYFGAIGILTFPFNLFFIPYYTLAIMAFFGHIAAIHQQKMKRQFLGRTPSQQAYIILFIGLVITFITFYGITNGLQGFSFPEEYQIIIGK